MKKFDLKIGAVVTPRELANVFNYCYMKNVMGAAYDSMNYIYIVRTQGGETIEAKANDEIVYLGLGEWKFYNRERG